MIGFYSFPSISVWPFSSWKSAYWKNSKKPSWELQHSAEQFLKAQAKVLVQNRGRSSNSAQLAERIKVQNFGRKLLGLETVGQTQRQHPLKS